MKDWSWEKAATVLGLVAAGIYIWVTVKGKCGCCLPGHEWWRKLIPGGGMQGGAYTPPPACHVELPVAAPHQTSVDPVAVTNPAPPVGLATPVPPQLAPPWNWNDGVYTYHFGAGDPSGQRPITITVTASGADASNLIPKFVPGAGVPKPCSAPNVVNQSPLKPDAQGLIHPVIGPKPSGYVPANSYGLGNNVFLWVSISDGRAWWGDATMNQIAHTPTAAETQSLRFEGVAL